jgi:hypothetical protein
MRPRSPGKDDKTDKTDKADKADKNDQDDKPLLPEQSQDETGVGWGEAPEPDDDERLRSERPPHWDQ